MCWNRSTPLERLYNRGEDKIESEMDIVKIIRNIRNLKIMMSNLVKLDLKTKQKLKLSGKNLINIDHSSDSLPESIDDENDISDLSDDEDMSNMRTTPN